MNINYILIYVQKQDNKFVLALRCYLCVTSKNLELPLYHWRSAHYWLVIRWAGRPESDPKVQKVTKLAKL